MRSFEAFSQPWLIAVLFTVIPVPASPADRGVSVRKRARRWGVVGTHLGERLVCLQRLRELVLDLRHVAQSVRKVFPSSMGDFILL